jgi:hypothetical protein
MQFSDITRSVQDAWEFAWPPLVLCVGFYSISRYFNEEATSDLLRSLAAVIKDYGTKLDGVRTVLEPYGLTKLVPIISIVAVIGLMYLINGPLTIAASNLPPYISYQPDRLITQNLSEQERILLVRRYPTTRSLNEAYYLALEGARSEMKEHARSNRAELWYQTQTFLKFALGAALIVLVLSIKAGMPTVGQLWKFFNLSLIVSGFWVVSLTGLLYQQEQQFHDEWRPIKLGLQKDAASVLSAPVTDEERMKIKLESDQRWWRVYVLDPYRLTWLKRTFLSATKHE